MKEAFHLGNVQTTISDRRIAVSSGSNLDHYIADVISSTDYYPFGSPMPGRNSNSADYRFGFNGQEMDNEISGQTGTHTTAMFWEYDSRLGRRWNLDPVYIASQSRYSCFLNNPILYADPYGDWIKGAGFFRNLFKSDTRIKAENRVDFLATQGIEASMQRNKEAGGWDVLYSTREQLNLANGNETFNTFAVENFGEKKNTGISGYKLDNVSAIVGNTSTTFTVSSLQFKGYIKLSKQNQFLGVTQKGVERVWDMTYEGGNGVGSVKNMKAQFTESVKLAKINLYTNLALGGVSAALIIYDYKTNPYYGESFGGKNTELASDFIALGAGFTPAWILSAAYFRIKPCLYLEKHGTYEDRYEYGSAFSYRPIPRTDKPKYYPKHTPGYSDAYSDERLKDNISKIDSALMKIMLINGYCFDWRTTNILGFTGKDIGVLAQEVQKVFPEIVKTDSLGYLKVEYYKLIPVLIESVKEQQEEIRRQQEEINVLKERMDKMESIINGLLLEKEDDNLFNQKQN